LSNGRAVIQYETLTSAFSAPATLTSCLYFPLAFCPYHIGHFSVVGLGFEDYVSAQRCIKRTYHSWMITVVFRYVLQRWNAYIIFCCRLKHPILTASSPLYWGTSSWLELSLSATYPPHATDHFVCEMIYTVFMCALFLTSTCCRWICSIHIQYDFIWFSNV